MLIASGSLPTIAILVENKSAGMVMSELASYPKVGGREGRTKRTDRQTNGERQKWAFEASKLNPSVTPPSTRPHPHNPS